MGTKNQIKLLRNNDERTYSDLEWVNEFYHFLQGEAPENISLRKGYQPKLSEKKAYEIIWYLQEHFPIIPDHIERCDNCGELFDCWSSGIYWQTKDKHYCDACDYLVPKNYDKGKR